MTPPREIKIQYTPGRQLPEKAIWEHGLKYTLYSKKSFPSQRRLIITYRRKRLSNEKET